MLLNKDYRRALEGGLWARGKREYKNKTHSAWIFIICLIGAILLVCVASCFAETYTYKEIARAIKRVENSVEYPYGIQSIDTKGDEKLAYKICLQSIRNNYKRWTNKGKQEPFLLFMGRRYCPPNYENWAYLVQYWLIRYREEAK